MKTTQVPGGKTWTPKPAEPATVPQKPRVTDFIFLDIYLTFAIGGAPLVAVLIAISTMLILSTHK